MERDRNFVFDLQRETRARFPGQWVFQNDDHDGLFFYRPGDHNLPPWPRERWVEVLQFVKPFYANRLQRQLPDPIICVRGLFTGILFPELLLE